MAPFSLITFAALAVACATLSVFVVSRRWAFIGEGISHSGFGGAGTAWLAAAFFPGTIFERPWMPYCGVVLFCLGTALAIGRLTRSQRVSSDTAIGVFMVASLAWGFVAQSIYYNYRARHQYPVGWDEFLFGNTHGVSSGFALGAVLVGVSVVGIVALLSKEIIYYCFDSTTAEASGVAVGFIHYLLMLLVAVTIIIGAKLIGTVLMTALLVLPGASALNLTRQLRWAVAGSIAVAVVGMFAGIVLAWRWPMLPVGPIVVLSLFVVFLTSAIGARLLKLTHSAA